MVIAILSGGTAPKRAHKSFFEPSLGSSTGLAHYSLQSHNRGARGCCARHVVAF